MPLALYCLSELEKGKDEIRCRECNDKWKFAYLKPAACLTQNEIIEFEQRAHINCCRNNQSEMNACPIGASHFLTHIHVMPKINGLFAKTALLVLVRHLSSAGLALASGRLV